MTEEISKLKSKFHTHFYAFVLISTGWFFGYILCFYSTFGCPFFKYIYNIEEEIEQEHIIENLYFLLYLGGFTCSLTFSYFYIKFGRYKIMMIMQFLNVICTVT